jgi:hypothetical protein
VSRPKTQARPTEERFLLRVDGQIKRSFTSKEDAATAGAVIKKAYPLVGGSAIGLLALSLNSTVTKTISRSPIFSRS